MKRDSNIFIVLIVLLAFISCEKKEPNPIDYRDKFVGKYNGEEINISYYYSQFSDTTYIDTTINKGVIVSITKNGDYPSQKICMNGGTPFTLDNSNKNDIGGYIGFTAVSFKYPSIQISSQYSTASYHQYNYKYEGIKQ